MPPRPFDGARATAHRARRDLDDARAILDAFAERRAPSPWRADRAAVARRLQALIARPDLIQQRRLNLCGPAVFLRAWARRDPAAIARFACDLYDHGEASLGGRTIRPFPGSLIDADHAALAAAHRDVPEAADWLLMGALRDSENAVAPFRGLPADNVSGMTFPSELVRWLEATGCYRRVVDRTTPLVPSTLAAARALAPSADTDVFVLVHLHALRELRQPTGRRRAAQFLLGAFPNHWAALVAPIEDAPGDRLRLRIWSWGTVLDGELARETWRANFYGAVVAEAAGGG